MTATMASNAFLKSIHTGLKHHEPLTLAINPQGTLSAKPMGFFARFSYWNNPQYRQMRLSEITALAVKTLAADQRHTIAEADTDRNIRACRALVKKAKIDRCNIPEIESLKNEVTAAKLGITSAILDKNPGLQRFAEKTYIERYIMHYGHEIMVNPDTLEVSILMGGIYQPWSRVYAEIQSWVPTTQKMNQVWVYGEDGLQNKNMYDWSELLPYKKGNSADWNCQYVFEFCTCQNPDSVYSGNHSWIRLKTPEGDIYSVGLYAPNKGGWTQNLANNFNVYPAYLMSPDVSEFWDFPISTLEIAITEDHFLAMKKAIEEDKINERVVFQQFNSSCMLFGKKIAAIGGIDIPTNAHVYKILAPPSFGEKCEQFLDKLPDTARKICVTIGSFFINCLHLILGGGKLSKDLNENQKAVAKPHITSTADLLNPEKACLHHPITFDSTTRKLAIEWRDREIKVLHEIEADLEKRIARVKEINLSLPPEWRKEV